MNDATFALQRTGGLLLAGGRSRRFGTEKATAPFRGRMLMDIVIATFADCAAFAVSAREGTAAACRASELGVDLLTDDPRHAEGPLAGICAGLGWANGKGLEFLATAPCDSPNLPHNLFAQLMARIAAAPAAYAVAGDGEYPLCALWSVALHAPLAKALSRGSHPPVRAFLAEHNARRILFESTPAFANVNTIEDLMRAEHSA